MNPPSSGTSLPGVPLRANTPPIAPRTRLALDLLIAGPPSLKPFCSSLNTLGNVIAADGRWFRQGATIRRLPTGENRLRYTHSGRDAAKKRNRDSSGIGCAGHESTT